jgi:exodeoxyribonuclease V gamma subunit
LLGRLSAAERAILPPLPVRVSVGDFVVDGAVGERTAAGLRLIRPAKFKVAELLRLWVLQVVSAVAAGGTVPDARLITADECWTVSAPEAPERVLRELLELWASGLCRPLPFFPRSAWAFTSPSGRKSPQDRALAAWESGFRAAGEGADPAFAFCFGAVEPHPFDDEFEALARRVCDPVWRLARKEGGK